MGRGKPLVEGRLGGVVHAGSNVGQGVRAGVVAGLALKDGGQCLRVVVVGVVPFLCLWRFH